MNLPKGPDTLCFDKDEFMKVRAGAPRPAGGLPSAALRGLLGLLPASPRRGRRSLRSESPRLRFGRCSLESALL